MVERRSTLGDVLGLLGDMPEEFEKKAVDALLPVLDEYESWLASGRPPMDRWLYIKILSDPLYAKYPTLRKIAQQVLE